MSSPLSCQDVRAQLARYLAGDLTEVESLAIEQHASECADCETLLDEATRLPTDAFAPPLPAELRQRTLAMVSGKRPRTFTRWIAVASTLAAAAAIFLVVRPPAAPMGTRPDSTLAVAPVVENPGDFADLSARPEFAELERAATELKAELTKSPGDAELQAFLEAVNTRRMELERRVKDARS